MEDLSSLLEAVSQRHARIEGQFPYCFRSPKEISSEIQAALGDQAVQDFLRTAKGLDTDADLAEYLTFLNIVELRLRLRQITQVEVLEFIRNPAVNMAKYFLILCEDAAVPRTPKDRHFLNERARHYGVPFEEPLWWPSH